MNRVKAECVDSCEGLLHLTGELFVAQDSWQPDADVQSPDRSVRLRVDQAGQVQVDLWDLHRHTDESLAGQVRAAARVALATLQADVGAAEQPDRTVDRRYGTAW
ncbi:hypothetical protein AB0M36_37140 [Actinoplanes sp. NPDC051346]|uniref:hypothetical protein n=1 Tax=Actinoplanes sp. NPDC051346 TaxID=3155048 RepID=UPI00342BACF2